jgi:cobalt-zinc-cadmium efflux system protein
VPEHPPHRHLHLPSGDTPSGVLALALTLLVGFMVAEVVVAVSAGSLALLSDAGHMLSDVGAIGAALWAARLAARPAAGEWTFGWKRAEILSAAGNGVLLFVASGLVTFEAIRRLVAPNDVAGGPVIVVAVVGAVLNVVIVRLLARGRRDGPRSLNVEGVFRHVLTDLYAFIGTIAAGIVILTTGFRRADAIASLLVAALMVRAGWSLLRDSGRILLEAAPPGIALDDVRAHLLEATHVRDVHDLHVWAVTSSLPALSAHLVVDDTCFSDNQLPQLLDDVQGCLRGHFDVDHSTFQFEPERHAAHEEGTHG